MTLRIQDPKYPTAPSLHESLLEACKDAIGGGAAFAFVSPGGVKLFLEDETFTEFVAGGRFDLVVGIDEITTPKALNALSAVAEDFPSLAVRVFHHNFPQVTFHPKFCWFRHKSGGVLIAGSGNLTARGLRRNWEAFTVSNLSPEEIDAVEKLWTDWIAVHAGWLKSPNDEAVMARAEQNVQRPAPRGTGETRPPRKEEVEEGDVDEVAQGPLLAEDAVLIAEIPRSGNRWNQANFDLDTFRNFFGAREGAVQRILLQHVNAAGTLGTLESRPSVSVKSQNYRFELEAAAGLAYPKQGRPVGVFVRVAPRTFKYHLVMPGDPSYVTVDKLLASLYKGRADRMRRVRTDIGILRRAWPNSPLLRTP